MVNQYLVNKMILIDRKLMINRTTCITKYLGTIRKNGNLELYDVDTKDTGNYSCTVSYTDPDNEDAIKNNYLHKIEVVTLPRYLLRGGNRYKLDDCDDVQLDALSTYLPHKLNEILCQNNICDAFIFAPECLHQEVIQSLNINNTIF